MAKMAEVSGLTELLIAFSRAKVEVYKANDQALADNALQLSEEIRSKAPIGETGELQASVDWHRVAPLHVVVTAGDEHTKKDGYDYARAVEFGTTKMTAEPFFFNTYRRLKRVMKARQKAATMTVIKDIFG